MLSHWVISVVRSFNDIMGTVLSFPWDGRGWAPKAPRKDQEGSLLLNLGKPGQLSPWSLPNQGAKLDVHTSNFHWPIRTETGHDSSDSGRIFLVTLLGFKKKKKGTNIFQ